jgi:tRNA 2-thiouridine synthesizing protein A
MEGRIRVNRASQVLRAYARLKLSIELNFYEFVQEPSVSQDNDTTVAYHREIDTRGLNCPLPILRAKKALGELDTGQILRIVATDPGSVRDFAAFAKQTGHSLLESRELGKEFIYRLMKR